MLEERKGKAPVVLGTGEEDFLVDSGICFFHSTFWGVFFSFSSWVLSVVAAVLPPLAPSSPSPAA